MDRPESQPKGQRVVPAGRVRDSGVRVRLTIPGHQARPEPTLELVRDGDVIYALDITCSCGQHIRVLCDYEGVAEG